MHKKAFTLIELLIVVAILAVLAAIAAPNYIEAATRAKVSRAANDLTAVRTMLQLDPGRNNPDKPDLFVEPHPPIYGFIDPFSERHNNRGYSGDTWAITPGHTQSFLYSTGPSRNESPERIKYDPTNGTDSHGWVMLRVY